MPSTRTPRAIRVAATLLTIVTLTLAGTGCNKDFKTTFVPAFFDGATTLSGEWLDQAGVVSSAWTTMVNGLLAAIEAAIYPEGS